MVMIMVIVCFSSQVVFECIASGTWKSHEVCLQEGSVEAVSTPNMGRAGAHLCGGTDLFFIFGEICADCIVRGLI